MGILSRFLIVDMAYVVADQSLETLAGLLNDGNINTVKVVVQCFPTVYALLFRSL